MNMWQMERDYFKGLFELLLLLVIPPEHSIFMISTKFVEPSNISQIINGQIENSSRVNMIIYYLAKAELNTP
jgi:hypothetical protein